MKVMIESTVFWLCKILIAPLISIVIGVIFADPIKILLRKFVKRPVIDPTIGTWVAEFDYFEGNVTRTYVEVVAIKKQFGGYSGRIVEDARNYDRLKAHAAKKPLRFTAERISDSLLTGIWYHPIETTHAHGAFQLVFSQDSQRAVGVWIGYSNTSRKVVSGEWRFQRA